MRIVVKYAKEGRVKYISHLELMRTLHRALRRADIPVAFSQGFNPQPRTAFTLPLPVGMTSEGEYMDIILESYLNPELLCQRMNEVLPNGITMLRAVEVDESLSSLMSLIERAVYLITIYDPVKDMDKKFNDFLKQNEIIIRKDGKKGKQRLINIRPMIHKAGIVNFQKTDTVIEAVLSTGSREYLNPNDMMDEFIAYAGEGNIERSYTVHRVDMLISSNNGWITPLEFGRGG